VRVSKVQHAAGCLARVLLRAILGSEAPALLRQAGETVLAPANIALVTAMAALLLAACAHLWKRGGMARVSAATLATTLAVDGLFLAAALLAPQWSGLI